MSREQQNQWEFGDLFEQQAEQVPTKKVYTVSEINRRAKNLLENQLGDVWVEGEVSGLRRQASGHCYFAIKDESGQISCALFRGTSSEAKSHLKDGAMVLIQGEVTLYEARGQYQMIVRKLELQGRGALQIKFEKLKAKQAGEYAANLVGHIVRLERSLDHLEDAGLAGERHTAVLLGTLVELSDLLHTPFRLDVAGAEDGNHQFRLIELTNNFLIENIVTCELLVTPDTGLFPHQLRQPILKDAMELGDPAPFILRDR